ncbi:MAG: calcium-binding protein [Burkholderiaceae bacterium]|nr:calcium-binding protein [Burkholderiaceae bacterium]
MALPTTLTNELNVLLFRTYNGSSGDDILYGDFGLTFFGLAYSAPQNDVMHGGAGNDQIYGNAGNDQLFGDQGNDFLDGGLGNDQLTGGAGADALQGEDGADQYHYTAASDSLLAQHDVVGGFDFTSDRFHFDGAPVLSTSTRSFESTSVRALDLLLGFVMRDAEVDEAALVRLTGAVEGTYLVVDRNGVAGFQANGDIVIELVGAIHLDRFGFEDVSA